MRREKARAVNPKSWADIPGRASVTVCGTQSGESIDKPPSPLEEVHTQDLPTMSTATIDRQLWQRGETGADKTVELAEISGTSLEGTDQSGLVILRVCLIIRLSGRSPSLLEDEAEKYCTLGRDASEWVEDGDGEANGECHG
jgi:hypothetical protein